MTAFLSGVTLKKRDGTEAKADTVLKDKIVGLYFSAHWCPPCRKFTPVLKDFYEELQGLPFEIVFLSSDRTEGDLNDYMDECHGDWYYIDWGHEQIKLLTKKYGIDGIPALIIIKPDPDGTVISKIGRGEVQGGGSPGQVLEKWQEAAIGGKK